MCGIAGIVQFREGPPIASALGAMAASLAHRGPDAQGVFEDRDAFPAVGLAHRRLSVIDLSHVADQPLANEDGTLQVLLNGEIYNFRELRQRLAGAHRFRSQGDTEAIVHGYEEHGDAVVRDLDGMFAFALWDSRRRRLLLARDRFGKKPLYYWHDAGRFVFGSEIKALLAAGVPAVFADERLLEYLAFGAVPTPWTLFRGIRKLEPASTLVVDANGVGEPQAYWELAFPPDAVPVSGDRDSALEELEHVLDAAVRKRLVADVPVGVLLSGGLDSSLVAAAAVRHSSGRVRTFTVGFATETWLDERDHARVVARHLGTEHVETVVRPEATSLLESLLHHYDEPFGDSSALPTYLVAREARAHVTVALNGDGGDEAFAGYGHFPAALLAGRMPPWLPGATSRILRALPGGPHDQTWLGKLRRYFDKAGRPFTERAFAWTTHFDLPMLEALDATGGFDASRLLAVYESCLARIPRGSPLSRLLFLNAKTYLLDDLLPKMDRMTMAHGLEARSPFLDLALMEFAARLPDGLKLGWLRGKRLLRPLARARLPPETVRRRKQGFGVPIADWFRRDLRPMVEDLLLNRPALASHLRGEAVARLVGDHLAGRADHAGRLWTLLTLEAWLRKHRFGGP